VSLKITVPVTLSKGDQGYWLQVETKDKQAAALCLSDQGGELTQSIFNKWGDEQLEAALLQRRRKTGLSDVTGTPVMEGDIVKRLDMPGHTDVFGVVKWDASVAAFVMEGMWPNQKLWRSKNLQGVQAAKVVGNAIQNPELLVPCRPLTADEIERLEGSP
jgi:hypothetical protein